jgi:hypothetical protein
MSKPNGRRTLLNLLLVCAFAACSSSPDLCTRGVNVVHKIENEFAACLPDAGFPMDTEAESEIAKCEGQIVHCNVDDLKILQNSATCYENLPQISCSWFAPEGSGINGGLGWGLLAYGCYPQELSAACTAVPALPLDAGFNF